jgi:predicted nuclease of predicted toxin-antitoxin system
MKEARSDWRRYPATRFVTDANFEPWGIYVMRYKRLDVMDAAVAGMRHIDDGAVFQRAWQLKRVLVTHDKDFLDDNLFPFNMCPGLLVLPTYGRVSMEFGNLLATATALISRGRELWYHTKVVARRDFVLRVRVWEKARGHVAEWEYQAPRGRSTT